MWPTSVTDGGRSHSINCTSGVTSISLPSVRPAQLRFSLARRTHPCIWWHGFPSVTGTMFGMVLSKKCFFPHVSHTRYLSIHAGAPNLRRTLYGLSSPAPTLEHLSLSLSTAAGVGWSQVSIPYKISMVPPLGSLPLRSAIVILVGGHRS
ncbi:hypothetical protein EI94DRAFT_1331202 [Lactarius quietus]|nr:hypothetical protein EI94DRAFT_1331202 [Lactarius quietus]